MATTKFYIQSEKEFAPIYARFSINAKTVLKRKTRETINPDFWKIENAKNLKEQKDNSKKIGKSGNVKNIEQLVTTAQMKKSLAETENKLKNLSIYIDEQYKKRKENEVIDNKWLDEIITAFYNNGRRTELLDDLKTFLKYYEKNKLPFRTIENGKNKGKVISDSTKGKYIDVITHLLNFIQKLENKRGAELKLKLTDYTKDFSDQFQEYLTNDLGHLPSSVGKNITYPKAILRVARDEMGLKVNETFMNVTIGMTTETPTPILIIDKYSGIDELQKIKDLLLINERLEITRDWMIIGIETGQRGKDLFALHPKQIILKNGKEYISLAQQKTGAKVEIPLHKDVVKIIEKYNGKFPPIFSENMESNFSIFNKNITRLCKLADLNRLDFGKRYNDETKRYEYGQFPIYDLFSMHCLRRTFASKYYGILSTAVVKAVTGHSTEQQLLNYINKSGNELTHQFHDYWEREELQRETKTAN